MYYIIIYLPTLYSSKIILKYFICYSVQHKLTIVRLANNNNIVDLK